jgi:hypothetical protein
MVTGLKCSPEASVASRSFVTLSTVKYQDLQIHVFRDGKELEALSSLYNHEVVVKASLDTFVTFYTVIDGRLEWLEYLNQDLYASGMLHAKVARTFDVKFKTLVVVTNRNCILTLVINLLGKHNIEPLDLTVQHKNGHGLVLAPNRQEVKLMCKISRANQIPRQFSLECKKGLLPGTFNASSKIHYYLNLDSLLTISHDVEKPYNCPPYSVKLLQSSCYKAQLYYEIRVSPSRGDLAEITVTAIETLFGGAYSIIHDEQGNNLVQLKTGTRLQGTFIFPVGTTDAGLHIYTPGGFSSDLGENPNTSLAHFLDFSVSYVSV